MDILAGDGTDLVNRIAAKKVSCVEVMSATLDRIAATNPKVNAIVSLRNSDDLVAEAAAADSMPPKGPLHGIPIAIKDLAETKGLRTTMGSPIFADYVPDADCAFVRRLKAAGAIVIGKTNTPEFGLGSHSYNPVHGVTRTPYDLARTAGGSSGGAAAALGARMVPLADGSDMMGSLRNPAAYCNVYGFRPSWGRIPTDAIGDTYLHRLATEGPMARSVRDIALMLEVMEGRDPNWPAPSFDQPTGAIKHLKADVAGRRIAWLGDWGGALPMEPGVLDVAGSVPEVLQTLGCVVEDAGAIHDIGQIWQSWLVLRWFSNAARSKPLYDDPAKRALLKPEAIWEIENGLALSAMDIHEASALRSAWLRRAVDLFQTYDALVLPSAQMFPFPAEWDWPKEIAGVAMDTYHRWMEIVVPASLLGLPALNVPAGFSDTGLPMGVQIIGAPGQDAAVLQLGEAYHQATKWPETHPPNL